MLSVTATKVLHERDVLLVDMSIVKLNWLNFAMSKNCNPCFCAVNTFLPDRVKLYGRVFLAPQSKLLGSALREIKFRTRYGLNIVGIYREGKAISDKLIDQPISQAPHAIFCLLLIVTMMAIDEIPNFIAVLIARFIGRVLY